MRGRRASTSSPCSAHARHCQRLFCCLSWPSMGRGYLLHTPSIKVLPYALLVSLLRDAARGVRHLHRHGTRHFNLRASNVLLWGTPLRAKVTDARLRVEWVSFGMGRSVERAHRAWVAPEMHVAIEPELARRAEEARGLRRERWRGRSWKLWGRRFIHLGLGWCQHECWQRRLAAAIRPCGRLCVRIAHL